MVEFIFVSAVVNSIMVVCIMTLQIHIALMLSKPKEKSRNNKAGASFVPPRLSSHADIYDTARLYGLDPQSKDNSVVLMTDERDDQILGFNKPDEDE